MLTIGVSNIDISLKDQLVTVDSTLPYEDVENAIKKTGKVVKSGKVVEPQVAAVQTPEVVAQ